MKTPLGTDISVAEEGAAQHRVCASLSFQAGLLDVPMQALIVGLGDVCMPDAMFLHGMCLHLHV